MPLSFLPQIIKLYDLVNGPTGNHILLNKVKLLLVYLQTVLKTL